MFTLIDAYAPLIFINAADSESGRVFSLLHEFVHIVILRLRLNSEQREELIGSLQKD